MLRQRGRVVAAGWSRPAREHRPVWCTGFGRGPPLSPRVICSSQHKSGTTDGASVVRIQHGTGRRTTCRNRLDSALTMPGYTCSESRKGCQEAYRVEAIVPTSPRCRCPSDPDGPHPVADVVLPTRTARVHRGPGGMEPTRRCTSALVVRDPCRRGASMRIASLPGGALGRY